MFNEFAKDSFEHRCGRFSIQVANCRYWWQWYGCNVAFNVFAKRRDIEIIHWKGKCTRWQEVKMWHEPIFVFYLSKFASKGQINTFAIVALRPDKLDGCSPYFINFSQFAFSSRIMNGWFIFVVSNWIQICSHTNWLNFLLIFCNFLWGFVFVVFGQLFWNLYNEVPFG